MTTIIRNLLLIGLIIVAVSGVAKAQQVSSGPVAVMEYERILQTSLATQSIQQQLMAIHDRIQAEIDAEEAALIKADQELTMQQTILAPESYQERRAQLDQRVDAVSQRVNGLNQRIDQAQKQATSEVQKAVFAIVSEIAAVRGFEIAIPTSVLIFAVPTLNITDEVLAQLNARLPRVEVQFAEP